MDGVNTPDKWMGVIGYHSWTFPYTDISHIYMLHSHSYKDPVSTSPSHQQYIYT